MKTNAVLNQIKDASSAFPFSRFRLLGIAILILIFFVSLIKTSVAQSNGGTLEVAKNKTIQIDRDSLILDELILKDSSKLVLTKPVNYIKAHRIVVGTGSQIIGIGLSGANGKNGKPAPTPTGLCKPGVNGESGNSGSEGEPGKDLTIEVAQLDISSVLNIDLYGGNGGDGGKGGKGSHGSNTTVHCVGNGGNGGSGGNGGNGGKGGTFSLFVKSPAKSEIVAKVNLTNRGGYRGLGGDGGQGGQRGIGASESKSKVGLLGKAGVDGQYGREGRMLFYSIFNVNNEQPAQTIITASGK